MLKPNVGLISSSGSLSKAAHIELFPAPSRPLECISISRLCRWTFISQKQNAHLLVLETGLSEDGEHNKTQKFTSSAPLRRFNIEWKMLYWQDSNVTGGACKNTLSRVETLRQRLILRPNARQTILSYLCLDWCNLRIRISLGYGEIFIAILYQRRGIVQHAPSTSVVIAIQAIHYWYLQKVNT